MYPPPFDYHRASSVAEALSLLTDLPDATVLAGGHALIPHLKNGRADPGAVVDVSEIPELTGVDVGREAIVVGAATTYADLLGTGTGTGDGDGDSGVSAGSTALDDNAPAFAEATRAVGDRQIRNRGTVGGNLAEAHPDSDLPAAALVADASVRIRGPDHEHEVAVEDFLTGPFESNIDDDELVTAVRIPHVDDGDAVDDVEGDADGGGAYIKKTHPTSGYAMVGVAARVAVADGELVAAHVAANGVADTAIRLSSVETALEGIDVTVDGAAERVNETVQDAAADVPAAVRRGDIHASAEYRVNVLPTYVERAVLAAVDNAETDSDGEPTSDAGRRADSQTDSRGGEPR